jgi:hypothetical protein
LDGIAKLISVQMDSEAISVAASRKRVTRQTGTGFQSSGNPLPQEREPVPSHAGDFNTEIPTETPAEEEVPEFPPEPVGLTAAGPAPTPVSLGTGKEFDQSHPILPTRNYTGNKTDGNAARAERIYRMVRPAQITLPTTDSKVRALAETVLLAYYERHGGEQQAADALRQFCQAWDAKYPTSPTNLAWLTEWASAGSIPQKAVPKQLKPNVVISDAPYCETGKQLFKLTLDDQSPDFSKHYRAWMSHLQTCEQCSGKKSKDRQPPASAPRDNPLKAMKGLAEGKRI